NIVDPTRLAVAGAVVELVHQATGRVRRSGSDTSGSFVLSGLEAGEYRIIASRERFKRNERRGVVLDTGQRLSVGDIVLEIGAVTETVSVTAQRAVVAHKPPTVPISLAVIRWTVC